MRSLDSDDRVMSDESDTITPGTTMPRAELTRMFTQRDVSMAGGLFRVGGSSAPIPGTGATQETVMLSDGTRITFDTVIPHTGVYTNTRRLRA
jgi:hypothetical protein